MSKFISYMTLLNDREKFRKAGGRGSSEFNYYDTPGHKYFKIFFHFGNGDVSGEQSIDSSNGFLAPTWLVPNVDVNNYYMYNSAWSYLKMNNENDRADLLQDFINLLSNISSESPWYFSEIEGLENALDRKPIHSDNFNIEASRQKLTIKCLPDSFDDRIGTLLDLYRSITWDWTTKREMIPSNLRKFDMSVFIFETPNEPFHVRHSPDISTSDTYSGIGGSSQHNRTSYKYIELHNCEIDYNSSKNLYSSLNNKEGKSVEYNLDVYFDDCYEVRYNEFMMREIGDMVLSDLDENNGQQKVTDFIYPSTIISEVLAGTPENERLSGFPEPPKMKSGFLVNAADQLIQTGVGAVKGLLKGAILGNLYTFSLTRIGDQMASLANGDILSTARNAAEYIRDAKQRKANQLNNMNIFNNDKVFVTANGSMGTLTGNTPDGPVSPMTGVSLAPDNVNSNFTIVDEVGNLNEGTPQSHFSQMTGTNKLNEGTPQSHFSQMTGTNKLNEGTPQSHFSISNNNGTLATKKRIIPKVKMLGNLFEGNTIANNL